MVFYSSLAVSHGVEVRSRTNEAKTAAFEQRHSCRIQANRRSAPRKCVIDKLFYWMNIVIARQRIDSLPMLTLPDGRIRAWFEVSL